MIDDLDRELDAALASYADVEPRAGLEQRVLARLERGERSRGWFTWALAIPALAALIIAVWWARPTEVPAPPPVIAARIPFVKRETPVVPTVTRHRRRPAAGELPKLAVFPSPSPLSEQERLLLAYVNRVGTQSVATATARNADEIKIPELEIKPLARADAAEGQ